jgi:seryl-tRNA synthetase
MAMTYDMEAFAQGLVDHGLILPSDQAGVFGRGPQFERVIDALGDHFNRLGVQDGADRINHPPVVSRKLLEQVNYLESFPHLCGSINSFMGNGLQALRLAEYARNGQPWGELMVESTLCMSPAACYSLYPTFTGTLPEAGRTVTIQNWVYRHEPSAEPTRMMSFRMREFVRVGSIEQVVPWREMWLKRQTEFLQALGLPVHSEVASDPFFGRGGKMMAASQVEQELKFELMVPVNSLESPTAVTSFNYHQTKFAEIFDIRMPGGELAHTACIGIGMERLTLSLFKHHGFVPDQWPADVQALLWPKVGA